MCTPHWRGSDIDWGRRRDQPTRARRSASGRPGGRLVRRRPTLPGLLRTGCSGASPAVARRLRPPHAPPVSPADVRARSGLLPTDLGPFRPPKIDDLRSGRPRGPFKRPRGPFERGPKHQWPTQPTEPNRTGHPTPDEPGPSNPPDRPPSPRHVP